MRAGAGGFGGEVKLDANYTLTRKSHSNDFTIVIELFADVSAKRFKLGEPHVAEGYTNRTLAEFTDACGTHYVRQVKRVFRELVKISFSGSATEEMRHVFASTGFEGGVKLLDGKATSSIDEILTKKANHLSVNVSSTMQGGTANFTPLFNAKMKSDAPLTNFALDVASGVTPDLKNATATAFILYEMRGLPGAPRQSAITWNSDREYDLGKISDLYAEWLQYYLTLDAILKKVDRRFYKATEDQLATFQRELDGRDSENAPTRRLYEAAQACMAKTNPTEPCGWPKDLPAQVPFPPYPPTLSQAIDNRDVDMAREAIRTKDPVSGVYSTEESTEFGERLLDVAIDRGLVEIVREIADHAPAALLNESTEMAYPQPRGGSFGPFRTKGPVFLRAGVKATIYALDAIEAGGAAAEGRSSNNRCLDEDPYVKMFDHLTKNPRVDLTAKFEPTLFGRYENARVLAGTVNCQKILELLRERERGYRIEESK